MDQEIDIEILITLIEQRPVLWDKTLESYKDRNKTREAWKEVCCAFKHDFENCSDAEKNEFDSTLTPEAPATIDSEEGGNGQQPPSNSQSTSKPVVGKTSRKRKPDEFERKIIDILEKLTGKGDTMDRKPHMNFFASLLPSLETFDDDETLEFEMDVLNAIKNIKNKRARLMPTTHTSVDPYRHYQPVSNLHAQPNVFTSQYSSFEVPRQQPSYLQQNPSTSSTPDTQLQYATSPQSQVASPLFVQSFDNSDTDLDFAKL